MAIRYDLVIDQGASFSTDIIVTDNIGDIINLMGYTVNAVMQRWYTSTNIIPFQATINNISGGIVLTMNAAVTNSIFPGKYVYDVQIATANQVTRVVDGYVEVTPAVTGASYPNTYTFSQIYSNNTSQISD
jgi:hypothetical protein